MRTWLAALMLIVAAAVGPAAAQTAEERDYAVDRALGGLDAAIAPAGGQAGVAPGTLGGAALSPSMDTGGATPGGRASGGIAGMDTLDAGEGGGAAAPAGIAEEVGAGPGPGADLGGGGAGDPGGGGDIDLGGGAGDLGGGSDTGGGTVSESLIDIDIDTGLGSVDFESDAEIVNDLGGSTEPIPSVDVDADLRESIDLDEGEVSTEANLETGVDTSGASTGSEAEVGVEADVSGGAEEDPATDATANLGLL